MKTSQNASTSCLNVKTLEKLVNFTNFKISWRQYKLKEGIINISNYGEQTNKNNSKNLLPEGF